MILGDEIEDQRIKKEYVSILQECINVKLNLIIAYNNTRPKSSQNLTWDFEFYEDWYKE